MIKLILQKPWRSGLFFSIAMPVMVVLLLSIIVGLIGFLIVGANPNDPSAGGAFAFLLVILIVKIYPYWGWLVPLCFGLFVFGYFLSKREISRIKKISNSDF